MNVNYVETQTNLSETTCYKKGERKRERSAQTTKKEKKKKPKKKSKEDNRTKKSQFDFLRA